MTNELNFDGITSANWKNIQGREIATGIYEYPLWNGSNGKRAVVFKFDPGSKFSGIDTHLSGPEQIYVISGVFNDGKDDHCEGSFINNPIGSAHVPQSKEGCVVLTTFPEG